MPVVESREEKTTAETEREHFLLRRASVIRKDDEAKSTFLFLPFNSVAFRCVGAESSRSSAENYNRPGPARLDPAHRLLVQGSSVTSRYKFLFFFFDIRMGRWDQYNFHYALIFQVKDLNCYIFLVLD